MSLENELILNSGLLLFSFFFFLFFGFFLFIEVLKREREIQKKRKIKKKREREGVVRKNDRLTIELVRDDNEQTLSLLLEGLKAV